MYSYEIEKLLKLKNYLISNREYFEICNTSPQIKRISCDDDNFRIQTSDNYDLHFKVYLKKDNLKQVS